MYCPQCGGANNDSVKYCSTCGYDLEEYKQKWGQEGSESAAQEGQPGAAPAPYAQAAAPTTQQPPAQPYPAPYQAPSQQPYQSQPPYQGQYQPQPPYGYGNVPKIPSYMGWAIVTLILCFWPTGIVAVVYAAQVGNKLAVGDFAGAKESSRKAKLWCWITFGIAIAGVVIAILIAILAAAATFSNV
jgi:hypothetical protein